MMESNSEMKIENNMEPKPIYTRKEKFNDSFFFRKPIVAEMNSQQSKDNKEQASFAFSYTQPHSMKTTSTPVMNFEVPVTVNHKKNAVMKRILRNAFPIAIVFVIANLFLTNSSSAQVTQLVNWTKGTDAAVAANTPSTTNITIPTTSTNRVL